jgi:hypothetical protein
MTDVDLEQKFLGQAEPAIGAARAHALAARCREIEALADVGDLARAAA